MKCSNAALSCNYWKFCMITLACVIKWCDITSVSSSAISPFDWLRADLSCYTNVPLAEWRNVTKSAQNVHKFDDFSAFSTVLSREECMINRIPCKCILIRSLSGMTKKCGMARYSNAFSGRDWWTSYQKTWTWYSLFIVHVDVILKIQLEHEKSIVFFESRHLSSSRPLPAIFNKFSNIFRIKEIQFKWKTVSRVDLRPIFKLNRKTKSNVNTA